MSETQIHFLLSAIFFTLVALASLDAVSSARLLSRRQAASPANDTTAQELGDIVRFLGPRNQVDFVAILQRNQGMGKRNFYTAIRPFVEALTIQYATLHKSYVRMAVVTFSSGASVVYDHISNGEGAKTKCEVFGGTSPLWDTVVYNNSDTVGANIGQALLVATAILTRGKQNRPNATQVILVVTDGDFTLADDPVSYLPKLQKDMQVKMFAAGLGPWFKPVSVSSLASKVSYYGQLQPHWENLLSTVRSSVASDVSPLWSRLSDSGICAFSGSNCSDVSSGCYCDVDKGVTWCRCDAGYSRLQSSSSIRCQVCPNGTYRSELDDDAICLPCSPGYGTVQSSNGTIHTSAGCQCLSGNNCTADPCAAGINPCFANEICSVNHTTGFVTCSCRPGFTSPSCSVNLDDCPSSRCANGAACYDRLNAAQCVCPFGFRGDGCQAKLDYCAFDICVRNQTLECTSQPNNYICHCLFGFIGDFCESQDPNPTQSSRVTTPAGLTVPSSTPPPPSSSAAAASTASTATPVIPYPPMTDPVLNPPFVTGTKKVLDKNGNQVEVQGIGINCTIGYNQTTIDDGAVFTADFYANDKYLSSYLAQSTNTLAPTPDGLLDSHYGSNITCKVRSFWKLSQDVMSPTLTSNTYQLPSRASTTSTSPPLLDILLGVLIPVGVIFIVVIIVVYVACKRNWCRNKTEANYEKTIALDNYQELQRASSGSGGDENYDKITDDEDYDKVADSIDDQNEYDDQIAPTTNEENKNDYLDLDLELSDDTHQPTNARQPDEEKP